jgi:type II secretory pathway component PulC
VGEQKITRAAVHEVVAAGLGQWLQGVQIERVLEGRKFKGWKIGVLHLANPCYAAVDLRPGDVVTAVNGKGPKQLERPETAQEIFASLMQAPAIEVSFLRNGQPRVLRFEIASTAP